jgi:hypothetical protein
VRSYTVGARGGSLGPPRAKLLRGPASSPLEAREQEPPAAAATSGRGRAGPPSPHARPTCARGRQALRGSSELHAWGTRGVAHGRDDLEPLPVHVLFLRERLFPQRLGRAEVVLLARGEGAGAGRRRRRARSPGLSRRAAARSRSPRRPWRGAGRTTLPTPRRPRAPERAAPRARARAATIAPGGWPGDSPWANRRVASPVPSREPVRWSSRACRAPQSSPGSRPRRSHSAATSARRRAAARSSDASSSHARSLGHERRRAPRRGARRTTLATASALRGPCRGMHRPPVAAWARSCTSTAARGLRDRSRIAAHSRVVAGSPRPRRQPSPGDLDTLTTRHLPCRTAGGLA